MHQTYFFLKHLSKELQAELVGQELAECFSQNKDEIIFGFCRPDHDFWVRALLHSDFCGLTFPSEFQRARQNSVDLLRELIGLKVIGVRQFENERCLAIEFEQNFTLLFKLFGQRSNLILFENNVAIHLFQRRLVQDREIDLDKLDRPIDQSYESFIQHGLKKTFPTFDKNILQELDLESKNIEEQWLRIKKVLTILEKPNFYVLEKNGKVQLSFFRKEPFLFETQTAIEASNELFRHFARSFYADQEKNTVLKNLLKEKEKAENYILKSEEKLLELETESSYTHFGDLIMANMHLIKPHMNTVELSDFYTQRNISVKLKTNLSPQKNAENYYRKARNQKIEIDKLKENIEEKRQKAQSLEQKIARLAELEHLKEIRKYLKENDLEDEKTQGVEFPFRKFVMEGFEIWIGRNAQNNDLLTQEYAYKEDLWLHARDVSGSHVIVKYRAGKPFPNAVIERAAQLAAYYSKRRHETLCPVIVTPKKFVRKPKGAEAGAVNIDKETVVMVEPKGFE